MKIKRETIQLENVDPDKILFHCSNGDENEIMKNGLEARIRK